ncbi:hypothetical protein P3T37_004727 [Kitasatospora sp. MAA4]|uniref:hypothetical protein n=1 Tax=Kitasatospora sp. MAA4 TaxID=3035093 RepID=UPI0024738234|nr:hypothetical protein [Kitasatospora sp. MAA4]MDH6135312.1 hypothetical protein [Kitasatospora sp. MAA4]
MSAGNARYFDWKWVEMRLSGSTFKQQIVLAVLVALTAILGVTAGQDMLAAPAQHAAVTVLADAPTAADGTPIVAPGTVLCGVRSRGLRVRRGSRSGR